MSSLNYRITVPRSCYVRNQNFHAVTQSIDAELHTFLSFGTHRLITVQEAEQLVIITVVLHGRGIQTFFEENAFSSFDTMNEWIIGKIKTFSAIQGFIKIEYVANC